jgi:menaquinone-9 beta-reductase
MRSVDIVGGGPAGAMAALAAMRGGAPVRIFEKSAFPRHKVCGEFLSPAILTLLRRAGCGAAFLQLRPAVLREMQLHFGARVIRHPLPEPAYGLSRHQLDLLLLQHAASAGAQVVREHWSAAAPGATVVLAAGRRSIAPAGDRLFGFKAHFSGPVNDAVELYFFESCYVGVSAIENGLTNVCGLAPERTLRSFGFRPGDFLQHCAPLAERLGPLTLTMDWLVTGPLVFSERLSQPAGQATYLAGDSLGFIDPFTGSGILNAMLTGELAGLAAARGASPEVYLRDCRRLLRRPFLVSAAFRAIVASGQAGLLASLVPGRFLFHATRPSGLKFGA